MLSPESHELAYCAIDSCVLQENDKCDLRLIVVLVVDYSVHKLSSGITPKPATNNNHSALDELKLKKLLSLKI